MRFTGSFLILFVLLVPEYSRAQDVATVIERARVAIQEGRMENAVSQLDRTISRDDSNPELHYLLATALADSSIDDVDRARKAIDRAIDLDPENVAYLELKLELMPSATKGFLPFLREQRRIDVANRILGIDSTSAVANEEIAIRAYREFREYHKAITFPLFAGRGNPVDPFDINWLRTQMAELDLSDRAMKNYDSAVSYFVRSISSDPTREATYRWLASLYALRQSYDDLREMLRTMRSNITESPEMWLYMGFVAFREERSEEAGRYFKRALGMMTDSEASVFESVVPILGPDSDQPDTDEMTDNFWESRDPRLLTEINERWLEHCSRMVYADLAYGELLSGTPGWDTEQGRIYVRYGEPLMDVVVRVDRDKGFFQGDDAESFNIWEYGDFKFVFDKPVEMTEYRYYSPSGAAMRGPTTRTSGQDYVIITRNNIRRIPERYDHDPDATRVEFPYLVSRFRGADGKNDIVIPFGIQVPFKPRRGSLRMPLTTGAFLLADSIGVADESRKSVTNLDSYQIFEFEDATTWVDVHQLSAASGDYAVSVEFESETGAIVGFHRSDIETVGWSGQDLSASDLLLAYHVEEAQPFSDLPDGFVERNDLHIQPAPWGVFSREQPLYFYIEAYNLTEGADGLSTYSLEAALVDNADDGAIEKLINSIFRSRSGDGVSVRFEGSTSSTENGQYLILDTSGQESGTYTLVVRYTDTVRGETVERRRTLILE